MLTRCQGAAIPPRWLGSLSALRARVRSFFLECQFCKILPCGLACARVEITLKSCRLVPSPWGALPHGRPVVPVHERCPLVGVGSRVPGWRVPPGRCKFDRSCTRCRGVGAASVPGGSAGVSNGGRGRSLQVPEGASAMPLYRVAFRSLNW